MKGWAIANIYIIDKKQNIYNPWMKVTCRLGGLVVLQEGKIYMSEPERN
jgi:hypothetical protein